MIDEQVKEAIRTLPKTELHLHIEGTLEPDLALRLAERNHVTLPFSGLEDLRSRYHFADLQSFLDLYYQLMGVLHTREDFSDLMFAYLTRAHEDGVRRAEIFFDPQVHMNNGLSYDLVLDGLQDGIARGRAEYGIDAALILCVVRDLPVDSAIALMDTAAPRADELLGIGLDSAEVGYPPELFQQVYARAAGMGLHLVAHAGEEGPAEYIRQALDLLHVERIDHGVHIVDDPALVQRVAKAGVPLTVCPLSNLRLQVVDDVAKVPVQRLLDAGVRVTVNSDDPAYFGGYIADNYAALAKTGLPLAALARIAANSIEACFAPESSKSALRADLDQWKAQHSTLLH